MDKNCLRVTVKYSIWVNGVKKTDGEIKIDKQYSKKDGDVWNATPKSHTWFTRFKPCDEIEIRWAEAPIIGEDLTTLKEVEIGKFRARQDKYTIPGDCSVSADGLTVSVMLPTDTQDATDNGLLASNSTTEPNPLSGGGGALPASRLVGVDGRRTPRSVDREGGDLRPIFTPGYCCPDARPRSA